MTELDTPPSSRRAPAKVDPETLVLRAKPAPVARFRRDAVIGIAATGSAAVAVAAWLALRPANLSLAASDEAPLPVAAKALPDVLVQAPEDYGDVPKLGAPLPGDLGKPILDRRRELRIASDAPIEVSMREAAREAERQRLAAEEHAARRSSVMLQTAGAAADNPPSIPAAMSAQLPAPSPAPDPPDFGSRRSGNAAFEPASGSAEVSPYRLVTPASPWTVQAGSIIAASLITGLNSDLPGLVTAQVTQNVYDSVTGKTLLIPQGSRLVGSYDSVVAFGQSRALVVWQRIILPDGSSIRIDNVPATDTQGNAGLSDRIDRHTWTLLKGVALSTLLGVGTELSFGSEESDLVRAVREAAQQSGTRAADELVTRNLDIEPTLRVRPGWPLRVVVHKDIVLRPWMEGR